MTGGSRRAGQADLVSLIEAAYAVELDQEGWLEGVVAAAAGALDRGKGTLGHVYRIDRQGCVASETWAASGVQDAVLREFQAGIAKMPPEYVARTFRTLLTATTTEIGGRESAGFAHDMAPFGVSDCLGINGWNPGGAGVWLGVLLPAPRTSSRAESFVNARVARHLAAALRLRKALAAKPSHAPEAILDPNGRIQHAEGEAKSAGSREALRAAVSAFDRARGPLRRRAPDEAVTSWRVLVQSRWSLLDHFERGGRRYVVAQINQLPKASPTQLTPRERQALAGLALGHSTKLIAYELGISDTTVRVLLSRAASKLGLGSRKALRAWASRLLTSK